MATEAQILANQKNSMLSTGPRDTSVVRYNALKHGLQSQTVLLKGEDELAFKELLAETRAKLQPDGSIENELVDQIAFSFWRIRRCRSADKTIVEGGSDLKGVKWADVFSSEYMEKFTRYETHAVNQIGRLLGILMAFREKTGTCIPGQ